MTMTTPPPGSHEAAQDLIEVRLKRAAEVAPVRIVTDYAMSSTSMPIRSVMLEAAQELATLRAALAPPADGAGEVEAQIRTRHEYWKAGHHLPAVSACGDRAVLLALLSEERARRVEVAFLLDRLAAFERSGDNMTEDGIRDWGGHVAPSIARLRTTHKDTQDE